MKESKKIIIVYTITDRKEKRKPFYGYDVEYDFWYLVLTPKVNRYIKNYMKRVSMDIRKSKSLTKDVKIKFIVKKYEGRKRG